MIATVLNDLKFLEVQERQSKNGNPFQLVVLADPLNYEKFEFFKRDDLLLNGININDNVKATLEISRRGFQTNVNLKSIEKSK